MIGLGQGLGLGQIASGGAGGGGGGGVATITVASGQVGSDLTNYPVYVNLADMPAGFWSGVDADGGNIRMKQDGSNIPFDLVKFDQGTETGVLFFLASSLLAASDNVFDVALDGDGLLAATDPNGRNACWAAYACVYLGEQSGGAGDTFIDRTGNTTGTRSGGSTSSITSQTISLGAGCGVDFADGSGARILFTGMPATTSGVFTIGCTAMTDINIGVTMVPMYSYGGADAAYFEARQFNSPDYWTLYDNANLRIGSTSYSVTGGVPRRLAGRHNGTTQRELYVNGALSATDNTITIMDEITAFSLGANSGGGFAFNGNVAYAYRRDKYLSADFIAAEYANLNSPNTFYTVA